MHHRAFLLAVLVAAAASDLVGKASAATYVVGDNQGWRVPTNPNDYSTWASRYKIFAVFNFTTGQHDVAEVRKEAFDGCSSTNPIVLTTVGPWNVTLNSTREHYYICTFGSHCSLGQKLAINVSAASSAPTPSPAPSPPIIPNPTPAPGVTPTPSPNSSPAPAPGSPAPTPTPGSPSPSMTPGSSLPGTPGGAPGTPGGLSPPSPPAPDSSAPLPTISASLMVFASVAFGLIA
ncbi:hypothetical protein SASPL_126523 [Salvia splendens]|uniref:Phytocyanin domain-containing protein n=1 Tax=Salvia splendens TaxID=180675 RepID=A0A8X8XKZ3_SALSN|nr:hypothetical protein SASPL_126523 [Salvia splendens]